jgi:hypothetical protein
MIRVILKHAVIGWLFLLITAFCLMSVSAPAYAADKAIAKLTSFSGTVLIKSRGDWGVKPEAGLSLYSDDKVVTKMGIATITFDDGAVIEVKANSNLLIRDTEQSGVGKQLGAVKRELRLFLGKLLFRSGKGSSTSTSLETTTMVCGLRGTAGTLSIDASGQTYLQFTEGGGDTIGNFISGIAADVPVEIASLNAAQRAGFVAAAAADQAKRAAEKVAAGQGTSAEAALASANAAEAAAREALAAAEAMLTSPDEAIRSEAKAAMALAQEAIDAALEAEQQAISAGATGAVLGKDTANLTATTGFDVQSGNFLKGKDDDAVLGSSYGVLGDSLTRQVFSPTTQGNENSILPNSDVNPPLLQVTSAPSGFDNSSSPVFEFYANESSTYFYQLDGGPLTKVGSAPENGLLSLSLSGLSDGNHTVDLIAIDSYGNKSNPQTFSWVKDTIAPVITLSSAPVVSGGVATTSIIFGHTNSEAGTVSYTLINLADGSAFSPTGLSAGTYGVGVIATDQAGNTSSAQFTFGVSSNVFSGNISGTGSVIAGTAQGAASEVIGQNWGGWRASLSGTWTGPHTGGLSLASGGMLPASGMWISLTSGDINASTGAATGTTEFIQLDSLFLTKGTGTLTGTFSSDGTWTGTESGSGLTTTALKYSGFISSSSFYKYATEIADTNTFGYAGVVPNGDLYDYVLLGTYTNEAGTGPYLNVATLMATDPLSGERPTAFLPTIWKDGLVTGFLSATYDDVETTGKAGLFYQGLTGNYYEKIGSYTGMWLSQGTITPIEMDSGIGIGEDTRTIVEPTFSDYTPLVFDQISGDILLNTEAVVAASASIPVKVYNADGSLDMLFGAWGAGLIGSYGEASNGWALSLEDIGVGTNTKVLLDFGPGSDDGSNTVNSTWNTSTNEISAFASGAWADLDNSVTGVEGGKLIGTFDPTAKTWQAVAAGGFVDTKTFLTMAATGAGRAKLAQLDIPCIQVGATDLTGSNAEGTLASVTMSGVKFFAYSTGESPKIWATGSVSGTTNATYGVDPSGQQIYLNGTGFSNVAFTMGNYDNSKVGGKWNASVSGSGIVSSNSIQIEGNAAGLVTTVGSVGAAAPTNGAFVGTASGVVRTPN